MQRWGVASDGGVERDGCLRSLAAEGGPWHGSKGRDGDVASLGRESLGLTAGDCECVCCAWPVISSTRAHEKGAWGEEEEEDG